MLQKSKLTKNAGAGYFQPAGIWNDQWPGGQYTKRVCRFNEIYNIISSAMMDIK
jgi:hypothetical protein